MLGGCRGSLVLSEERTVSTTSPYLLLCLSNTGKCFVSVVNFFFFFFGVHESKRRFKSGIYFKCLISPINSPQNNYKVVFSILLFRCFKSLLKFVRLMYISVYYYYT